MILDSSAIVAVLRGKPETEAFLHAITQAGVVRLSAATFLEAVIVIDSRRDPISSRGLEDLIRQAPAVIEPVTVEQATLAREAYRLGRRPESLALEGHPRARSVSRLR